MYAKILTITFLIQLALIYCSHSEKKFFSSMNNEKRVGFTYRTLLFQNEDKSYTKLQPDAKSSPLRVSKEELGRFSWTLLHSIAAAYPVEPTSKDKSRVVNFLEAALYPCKDCGHHLEAMLEQYPIKNNSRKELVLYMCFLHNKVNERLGKAIFDCEKALEYWGGDCGCSSS